MNLRSIGCSTLVLAAACGVASAQTVREKVAVDVVTVRVTARDSAGKRIEDLKASDLILTVDGKPVSIETFSGPGAALPAIAPVAPAPVPGPTLGPGRATEPADTASPMPDEAFQRVLIFVDEVQTNPFDRRDVCEELARYVLTPGPANREFRIARFDGRLEMETGWTRDAGQVASALRRIGTGGKSERIPSPGELGDATGSTAYSSAAWIQLHQDRLHEALLETLADFPQSTPKGRLLLVTGGTTLMRPEDLAFVLQNSTLSSNPTQTAKKHTQLINDTLGDGRNQELQRTTFVLWSRAVNPNGHVLTTADLVAKAVEEGIELVPVYAEAAGRGEFDLSKRSEALGTDPGQTGMNVPTAGDGRLTPHLAAASALAEIAGETGAEAVLVGRKAGSRLAEIDSRAGYALSFRDPYGDHVSHQIWLRCQRPGVRIEYRRGYRIPQDDERTLDTVVAGFLEPARRSNPMSTEIVQAASLNAKQKPATKLAISYSPPLETGAAAERPVSVVAVGEDRNGDRTEPVEWSGTAFREAGADVFETDFLLNVPPNYAWSVAVRDQPTGLISYVFVPAPARP